MWYNQITSFFTGYVEILIRGAQLEKIINLLTGSGFYLWDVKRLGAEVVHAKLRSHGFLAIRPLVKKSGVTVKIRRKRGWPYLYRRLADRKTFLLGAAVMIGLLLYLSTLTLFIKVEGFGGPERKQLLKNLNKAGLKPGRLRKELLREKQRIERDTIINTPEAVWLGINFKGVVAEVKAVRRKTLPSSSRGGDLIAERDGLITRIAVIRGQPVVKEGDIVARGDLLISGRLWHSDPQTGEVVVENVPADGIVEARVWYDVEVIQPKKIWRSFSLKKKKTVYSIRWGGYGRKILGIGGQPKGEWVWGRYRKRIFFGRNPGRTVELIKDIWQEVKWEKLNLSMAEVKREALREAKHKQKYLTGLNIGTPTETWIDQGDFLKLIMTFEATQDIAALAPHRKEN